MFNPGDSKFNCAALGLAAVSLFGCQTKQERPAELPNILWITTEDNSAYFLGCYGNEMATTPNLDRLASEGFMYTHAYANCPVCAPARNTIISGVYAASNGNEQMRSTYAKSEDVRLYPEYLHEAGYYCTNNVKTDYNYKGDWESIWDECSNEATYLNRPDGKPFFAVFNLMTTHESQIFNQIPEGELRHDPDKIEIPPYHPDLPEIRHDWAQYYDLNEKMDAQVGELLKQLEESGEADNTIVVYYGDHGGVLARSKRYLYNTGTQVPFIIRIPEKYKYLYPAKKTGSKVDRLVSFVDLAPTLLSITGTPIPDYMQGSAFLGDQRTEDPQYVFMTRQRMDERYDMVRAVTDGKYRYIRNYMPFRITMQHVAYLFNAPSAQAWEDAFNRGETNEVQSRFFREKPLEELYDTENDPWEIKNLAGDPVYADILDKMREVETNWMREIRDAGLVPETEYERYSGNKSMYDYMRSEECPFEELLEAAQSATTAEGDDLIGAYMSCLDSDNNAVRFWGVVGLLIHIDDAKPATDKLVKLAEDESVSVSVLAAETLYRMDERDRAIPAYIRILQDEGYRMMDRNYALNSIDAAGIRDHEVTETITGFRDKNKDVLQEFSRFSSYDVSMAVYLLTKWARQDQESDNSTEPE